MFAQDLTPPPFFQVEDFTTREERRVTKDDAAIALESDASRDSLIQVWLERIRSFFGQRPVASPPSLR